MNINFLNRKSVAQLNNYKLLREFFIVGSNELYSCSYSQHGVTVTALGTELYSLNLRSLECVILVVM